MSHPRPIDKQRSVSANPKRKPLDQSIIQKSILNKVGRVHTTESIQLNTPVKKHRKRVYTTTAQYTVVKKNQKQTKQPEQLVEENFHLKHQLQDLNNELYLTRFKIQSQKKKNAIYAKKLNRQFEKQLYWPKQKQNDYLIAGIKHQYEILKLKYNEKCRQISSIKQTLSYTETLELNAYCESLSTQNQVLVQKVNYLANQIKTSYKQFGRESSSAFSKDKESIYQGSILEEKRKIERILNQNKSLEQKLAQSSSTEKQLQKKIKFLQKLIIQKQNQSYQAHKKVKIVQREKSKLLTQIKNLQHAKNQAQKKYGQQIQQMQGNNLKQANAQKLIFQKFLRQKNGMIQKLQKQIGYLSTLLSYWKPLDQLDNFDKMDNTSHKQKSLNQIHNSSSLHSGSKALHSRSKTPVNPLLFQQQSSSQYGKFTSKTLNNQQFNLNSDLTLQSIHQPQNSGDQGLSKRSPRRSTDKWTSQSKKCRKVNLSQIQYLGQFIRYKMIANRKSFSQVRQLFSFNKLKHSSSNSVHDQLITMKQAKQTLMQKPFSLTDEEAYMLSRYVIENEGSEFVYCHEGNEMERSIVKSIIKSIVGDYELPNVEKCELQWKEIKKMYSHNMQLALRSICPKGVISKDKFLQLTHSLGIQMTQQTKNYLVGRLIETKASLSNLQYDDLFTNEERIQ